MSATMAVADWIKRIADDERRRDTARRREDELTGRKADLVRQNGQCLIHELGSASLPTLIAGRHNILLEGPKAWTDAVVLRLQPHFRPPITRERPGVAFHLTGGDVGALILQDVDLLSTAEQRRLLAWMSSASRHTKVVSTTTLQLFPLVARGLFDAGLYYRLNMMLLQADSEPDVSSTECTSAQRATTALA